ncbi:MAG: ParB/RepB/Spo0J family partition protein [Saprospiraceae bacterium]|nr:ParB/RepB/Spo0J family partition protein [Saprospiraceae bacterium]
MEKKVKRAELGKGIRALLANIDVEVQNNPQKVVRELTNNVAIVPLDAIEVNPFQPRRHFDENALNELSNSIKVHGLIQPITIRRLNDVSYQLISGERRLRASRLAGLVEVPAYIRLANDQEMLEMALVENIQREELNAVEIAITYQRLIDECSLTHENLSGRVGKNRSTITNYLRLLKLPPEIQQSLKMGQISMGHARTLVSINDVALQLSLFKQIIEQDLSVRAIENLVQQYESAKEKKNVNKSKDSYKYKEVQDRFSNFFGSKVNVKANSQGKGNVVINFDSNDELNRLLDIIENTEVN